MSLTTGTLTKQIAVIAGGSGGIGSATALRLAQNGFYPVIIDKDEVAGKTVLEKLRQLGKDGELLSLDLTKKADVQSAFSKIISKYGTTHVLVNLAGGTLHAKPVQHFLLREWQEVIDVNLKATFLCCQAVIGVMKRQRRGVIVNTCSDFGVTGSSTRTAYSAAKAAIIAFTKSLALELAPYGVRVNVIGPGRTETQRVLKVYTPQAWAEAVRRIPMGRAAQPMEIAEGIAFLASEESSYITGQRLHVNGGSVMP